MTRSFDVAGAVSVTAGLSLLVYALVDATDAGWGSTQTIGLLALSAALLARLRGDRAALGGPLVPFRIFRLRTLTGANVVGLLVGASLFSMFFFISLYMQQVLGYSPIKAGLSYLPLAVTIIISAGVASQLVTRVGFKPVLIAGLVFIAAGLIWFSQVSVGGSYVGDVLGPSLLAAVGLGFAFVPVTIAAVAGVRGTRSRARQRADQHLAAGRRRARACDPRDGRELAHRRPDGECGRQPGRAAERAHRGLPGRLPGGRRVRRCSASCSR